ncbi:hypothetical protein ZOSMA_267G00390 [Zostera marina]|uniref:WRKY domain-containing protein n=1 Tax=Zostera marina TaxID=29655 RepID=A0A0K9PGX0_ZOSMR|nr:hypothetical protein ZOSMA_267G00390 [Zostera marina]
MENHLIAEINNSRAFVKKLQPLLDQQDLHCLDISSIKSLVNSLTASIENTMTHAQFAIFQGEQIKPEDTPRVQNRRSKKRIRRSKEKFTRHVKMTVNLAKGLAESLEDGYHWKKYGQKNILGTKHPKGYFRCTYSQSRQCLATKHVQMSDGDQTVFDVTYFGEHSCFPGESKNKETVPPDHDVITENASLSFLDTSVLSLPDMSELFCQDYLTLENEFSFDDVNYYLS